jgi:hypothetical protein
VLGGAGTVVYWNVRIRAQHARKGVSRGRPKIHLSDADTSQGAAARRGWILMPARCVFERISGVEVSKVIGSLIAVAWACLAVECLAAPDTAQSEISHNDTRSAPRDWAPQDSVRVRYFLGNQDTATWVRSDAIVPSPKGKYFFFVSHRGDLNCDL